MTTIGIKGMSCNHCVMAVTKALGAIAGLGNIKVDLQSGKATFDNDGTVSEETIRQTIQKAGYDVE